MELTPQKDEVTQSRTLGAAFLCRCFIWSERSSGECAVGHSPGALRHLSAAQKRNDADLVRRRAGAGLCLAYRAHRRKPLPWNVAMRGRPLHPRRRYTCCHPRTGQFRILSPICPHLGCSVRWVGDENKFICPCHSGSFTADGERIAGPPPRSMDSLESKVEDGVLKVRYQYFRQLVPNKEVMA